MSWFKLHDHPVTEKKKAYVSYTYFFIHFFQIHFDNQTNKYIVGDVNIDK